MHVFGHEQRRLSHRAVRQRLRLSLDHAVPCLMWSCLGCIVLPHTCFRYHEHRRRASSRSGKPLLFQCVQGIVASMMVFDTVVASALLTLQLTCTVPGKVQGLARENAKAQAPTICRRMSCVCISNLHGVAKL